MKKAWLYIGVGIKRWLAVVVLGVLVSGFGLAFILNVDVLGRLERWLRTLLNPAGVWHPAYSLGIGGGLLALGLFLAAFGLSRAARALVAAVWTGSGEALANRLYDQHHLQKGPKVVAIGGGTGLSTLLRGLKAYTSNITAIVTVADDGGSSGRLREELGILPPGDIRNTLVALADTEPLMEELFQYRFQRGEGLQGHTFGNLFLASLTEVTGDFELAIRESSRVLAVRGRVLPATLDSVRLQATFTDGTMAQGESRITAQGKQIAKLELLPEGVRPIPEALEAIAEADLIVIGPGSLFTSLMPHFLIPDMVEAIRAAKAPKVFVCNVMTQPGETDGFTASRHLQVLYDQVGPGLVDVCIVNGQPFPEDVLRRYEAEGAVPVAVDREAIEALGVRPVVRALLDENHMARHHPDRLAMAVLEQLVRPWTL